MGGLATGLLLEIQMLVDMGARSEGRLVREPAAATAAGRRSRAPRVVGGHTATAAAADGVKRSSGSDVRLPTTVMTVSPAMEGFLRLRPWRQRAWPRRA